MSYSWSIQLEKKTDEFQRMATMVFGFGFFLGSECTEFPVAIWPANSAWDLSCNFGFESNKSASSWSSWHLALHLFMFNDFRQRPRFTMWRSPSKNSAIRGPLAVWLGATPSNNALDRLEETSTPTQKQQQLDGYTPEWMEDAFPFQLGDFLLPC